ncbi:glycosyltransferase family 4 protein [Mucilaginibacter sp. NFX135]|uniref:glycosyltransferase family 4 protein n=1 Tax=Mucilaginibacter sp. NFX135 TaxID=3402687 RepID=UPI003AFA79B3
MTKFIVGQLGVPRHSAAAKALYERGLLDQFVTDTYFSTKGSLANLPLIGPKLTAKYKKYDPGFTNDVVSGDWLGALSFRFRLKYSDRITAFKAANKRLGDRLIAYAKDKQPGKYFGFDTISIDFLEWGHDKGWKAYLEQCVAPRSSQIEMWQLFQEKYGIDYSSHIDYCRFQQDIERKEWGYSSNIIVPSEYVKNELIKDGSVDINKVSVVNYGYTPNVSRETILNQIEQKFAKKQNSFNILFAGNSGYRKGIKDILTIAEAFKNEPVQFLLAGLLENDAQDLVQKYPNKNLIYLGKLSNEELAKQYLNADLFFFPSYLEGSALVLIEAMSWGLPIVTTYQSGSVIEDGLNGFLNNSGDVEGLKSSITKLLAQPELRFNMAISSLEKSALYSVKEYGIKLTDVLINK